MADENIFDQSFDSLLQSVGVELENKTETTNAPNEEIEPEQVAEAADKVETVAKKEANKEKTTEDYRVDLDVFGGAADDETVAQSEPPVETSTNVDNAETNTEVAKDPKTTTPSKNDDVWGDPIGVITEDTKTENPFNQSKTVDNAKSTKSSVWGGPSSDGDDKMHPKTVDNAKSTKSSVWGGPSSDGNDKTHPKTVDNAKSTKSSVWGGSSNNDNSTPKEAVATKSEPKAKPKTKPNAEPKAKPSVTTNAKPNKDSKEVVANNKTTSAKNKKSAAKSSITNPSIDVSVDLPEWVTALLGDEQFDAIKDKTVNFILEEVKSTAQYMVDQEISKRFTNK